MSPDAVRMKLSWLEFLYCLYPVSITWDGVL